MKLYGLGSIHFNSPGPMDVEVRLTEFADDTTPLLVDDDSITKAF